MNEFENKKLIRAYIFLAIIFVAIGYLYDTKKFFKASAYVSDSSSSLISYNPGQTKSVSILLASVAAKSSNQAAKKPVFSGGGIGLAAPILSEIKIVGGKRICGKENDHPKKSKKNSPGHIDSECCLDPDEIPNSQCYYPAEKYGKFIQKYLSNRK